jgi:hypothetical protein
MSDKPREWWIYQSIHTGAAHFSDAPKDDVASLKFMNHVIEYSAYEAMKELDKAAEIAIAIGFAHNEMVKERDEARAERDRAQAELSLCLESDFKSYKAVVEERDEALKVAKFASGDGWNELPILRARSAKLAEALKLIIAPGMDPAGVAYGAMEIAREALAEYESQDSTTESGS